MSTDAPTRGGFLGFMSTLRGLLVAVAGVITALATYVGVQVSVSGPEDGSVPVAVVTVAPAPAPAPPSPEDLGEVDVPSDASAEVDAGDPVGELLDACDTGDVSACAAALDGLAEECYDGLLASCDLLYWMSPVDSDYEYYGATCGLRLEDDSYAGYCDES